MLHNKWVKPLSAFRSSIPFCHTPLDYETMTRISLLGFSVSLGRCDVMDAKAPPRTSAKGIRDMKSGVQHGGKAY